ncbi:MAG: AMP-binding protein [Ferruginibacter sp.]
MILHHPFEKHAESTPDAIATIFRDEKITYAQLNNYANELSILLLEYNVSADSPIGIYLHASPEFIASILAVLKIGRQIVPLDSRLSPDQIDLIISDASINLIITGKGMSDHLLNYKGKKILIFPIHHYNYEKIIINLYTDIEPDNVCAIFYTSGTTGRPKGTMLTHASVSMAISCATDLLKLQQSDRHLFKTSTGFASVLGEIFTPLNTGSSIVIADPEKSADLNYIFNLIKEKEINIVGVTPSVLPLLCEKNNQVNCSSVRIIVSSGEGLNTKTQNECLNNIKAELHKFYGLTEAPCIAHAKCKIENEQNAIIIGEPTYYNVYILNENLQKVQSGERGEIYVNGPLTRGYLNQPKLTAERYIPDPFAEKKGTLMFKTGDMGIQLADGQIQFLGRIDQQVKIRGYRVEPAEIEHQLLKYAGISQVVVIAKEDNRGGKYLTAYYVTQPPLNEYNLREHLSILLPDYMIPSFFVELAEMPLTANGKINRKALPEPDIQRKEYIAPGNKIELQLHKVWAKILGIENISITDNFFHIGGDSIKAMQIIAAMRRDGFSISFSNIFTHNTIASLASFVKARKQNKRIVEIQTKGTKNPLFGVNHFWIYRKLNTYLDKNQPVYCLEGSQSKKIEEIASDYIKEIKSVKPLGPYFIVGYCINGKTALKIAQLLSLHADKVSVLILIETRGPNVENHLLKYAYLSRWCRLHLPMLHNLSKNKIIRFFLKPPLKIYASIIRKYSNASTPTMDVNPKIPLLNTQIEKVILIEANDHFISYPLMGWANYFDCEVEMIKLKGKPDDLLKEPNILKLAEIINTALVTDEQSLVDI